MLKSLVYFVLPQASHGEEDPESRYRGVFVFRVECRYAIYYELYV